MESNEIAQALRRSHCVYFVKEHGYPVICEDCWTPRSNLSKAQYPDIGETDSDIEFLESLKRLCTFLAGNPS